MRVTTIIAALGAAFLSTTAPMAVGAQAPEPGSAPHWVPEISTSAIGEVKTAPDRATMVLGVETRSATAAAAGTQNARKQTAVIAALRAAGVAEADIATVSYTMTPDMQYDEKLRTSRVVGYVARNMVRVQVKEIDRIGGYIDAAIEAGANGVNSLDFSASRAEEFRRTALQTAMQRACRDAAAMAGAAGGRLGMLVQAVSNEVPNYPPPMPMYARAEMADAKASTPISPGEMTVSVTVQTRWRFVSNADAAGAGPAPTCE
ncbi:MAG: SIMPL domain-containing protein [Gemmatimonadaceae bacterium]